MRVIVNENHGRHAPLHECENGLPTPPYEVPGRIAAIRTALEAAGGFAFEVAPPIGEEKLAALHDPAYVAYLRSTSAAIARQPKELPAFVLPSVFPYCSQSRPRGKSQAGGYCFDTYTSIVAGTFAAAPGSAARPPRRARPLRRLQLLQQRRPRRRPARLSRQGCRARSRRPPRQRHA